MQCTSYLSGCYYSRDQTLDASESLWEQFNNGVFCRSGRDYNILFQPPIIDQFLGYNKEIVRETMLKHDAIFKYQVYELHRLYGRQKKLMDEIRIRALTKDHLQMQTSPSNPFVSQMRCDISQKALQIPYWLLLNSRGDKPSAEGERNFQKPLSFVSTKSIKAGSDIYLAENHLKELGVSSCGMNYGKRMLDLELPAEEYMDSDEGEQLEEEKSADLPPVLPDPSISILDTSPQSNLIPNQGVFSNFDSSSRTRSCLFDLNEPVQYDEPLSTNSTSLVDSNTSSTEIMHQDQDLSRKPISKSSVLIEIAHDVLEGKGIEGSSLISGLKVPFTGKLSPSCKGKTSFGSQFAEKGQDFFDTNKQKMLSPCKTTSAQLVQLSNETNTKASSSVSSRRASFCKFKEVPVAIQALPCFHTSRFSRRTTRLSIGSSGIKGDYLCSNRKSACSPGLGGITSHMSCHSDNQPTAKHYSIAKCVKDSDHTNSVVDMDLNVIPSSSLPETEVSQEMIRSIDGENDFEYSVGQLNGVRDKLDYEGKLVLCPELLGTPISNSQFCGVTSITSHSNSSENEDMQNDKSTDIPAIIMAYDSSHKSGSCPEDDTYLSTKSGKEIPESRTSIDLHFSIREPKRSEVPTVITAVGTDLKAPVSPENKEHFPPREGSEDNQSEKLGNSVKDLDRIAAEAIVSISLFGDKQHPNTSISGPIEASLDCLNWFAGIVSSVAGDVDNEFEDTLTDEPIVICNEIATYVLERSEVTGTKVEDHCYNTHHQKNKSIRDIAWPSQQGRGQAQKAGEWKEFQSEVLPSASSLSSDFASENLRPVKDLTLASRTSHETVKGRRNAGRIGRARGRRQSKKSPPNMTRKRMCSLSKQHACEDAQSFLQRSGWGNKNRRQKHFRARSSFHLLFT